MYQSQFELFNQAQSNYPYICTDITNLSYDIPHYHQELEIVYVAQGRLIAVCETQEFSACAGEFFLFMPGEVHCFRSPERNLIHYIKLCAVSKQEKVDFSALRLQKRSIQATDPLHALLCPAILEIFEEDAKKQLGYEFAVNRCIHEICRNLLRFGNLIPITKDELSRRDSLLMLIQNVNAYIEQNYQERVELETVARACGYSKFYFAHSFGEAMHMSFYNYLTLFRLEKAMALMRIGQKSMTEIAYECGFGSIRSFDRMFQKHCRMSPSEFCKLG